MASPAPQRSSTIANRIVNPSHKRVAGSFMTFAAISAILAGMLTICMRLELVTPEIQYLCSSGLRLIPADPTCAPNTQLWTLLTGAPTLLLLIFVVIPMLCGTGTYYVPNHTGSKRMAFQWLSALSVWMYAGGVLLGILSIFSPYGATTPDNGVGWVLYPPLSVQNDGPYINMMQMALYLCMGSSIATSINIISTALFKRSSGVIWITLPLFSKLMFAVSWLFLLALPYAFGTLSMMMSDRNFGSHFFDPSGGADPVVYQHILWFFGHPEVYIALLNIVISPAIVPFHLIVLWVL